MLVKLPSKGMRILRSMGSRRRSQTCCIDKGRACGWITPSWWHCFVLQRITSRRTRIEMEWWIKIVRFREGQKTASVKRNHATPYSSALPLIVYVRVRPQNYWYFTAHNPKVLHLSQQRLRHNEVSSKNFHHLRNHREVLTMIETIEMSEPTRSMNAEKRKVDETAKQLRAALPKLHPLMRVHHDPMTKQTNSPRCTKQARITKTRAEANHNISFLFLQARMVDMWGGNEERMLSPPEMQTVS